MRREIESTVGDIVVLWQQGDLLKLQVQHNERFVQTNKPKHSRRVRQRASLQVNSGHQLGWPIRLR